jgi:PAS domain S-box-containing protein
LDGIITSWNRGAEKIYGYSAEEIIGRPTSVLIPSDRPDERTEIVKRIRRGERIEHFETERLNKEGRRIALSLTCSPIRNAKDELTG